MKIEDRSIFYFPYSTSIFHFLSSIVNFRIKYMEHKPIIFVQKIIKPWGYEMILTPPESPTVAKIIHISQGCRFSLQYHEIKQETLVLVTGEAYLIYGPDKNNLDRIPMDWNKGYFIPKGLVHRCEAVKDCDIFESSTKELGKTIRLEDDYSRGDETEEERKLIQSSK